MSVPSDVLGWAERLARRTLADLGSPQVLAAEMRVTIRLPNETLKTFAVQALPMLDQSQAIRQTIDETRNPN